MQMLDVMKCKQIGEAGNGNLTFPRHREAVRAPLAIADDRPKGTIS